jgi:hypothetical protein
MKIYREGAWHVFETQTTKTFEVFKQDATWGLRQGMSALFTTYEWQGQQCYIWSAGTESTLQFDRGRILCRVRFNGLPATLFRREILSNVEQTTRHASGDFA